jgi:septal ring factor EnvC (AmiA/AmiB activator)
MSASNTSVSTTFSQTKYRVVKWAIIALCIAIGAPLAILLVKGLVGLVLAAVIGLAAINFGPVIAMKFANQKVKMVVAEAKNNPIETLYNELAEKQEAAEKFKKSITDFRTEVKNFADKTVQFKKQYPEDAARFEAQLATMNKLLAFREGRYKQVQDELKRFADAIDRARALWDMSQSAQRMNKIAGLQTSDTFAQIKTDAALDSVMNSVNKAFSEMETSLMENAEVQQAKAAATEIGDTAPPQKLGSPTASE